MLCSKEYLLSLVKINMEEGFTQCGDTPLQIEEGTGVEAYIESKLPEAITQIFMFAPDTLLQHHDALSILKPNKKQNGSGEILLPKDMLRFSKLKMKGWDREVTTFHSPDSSVAALQNTPYTMAGRAKPVVVMSVGAEGEKYLKYYSLPPEIREHKIESALYVRKPNLASPIEIDEMLIPSITYLAAAMVFEIFGDIERATLMRSRITIS